MAEPAGDPRLSLAYDAAVKLLSVQDGTLGNLRNRATGILSVAALAVSFSVGLGLLNRDPAKGPVFPNWGSLALLATLICIGFFVMVVLWPIRGWSYGAHPGVILQKIKEEESEDSIRQFVASALASDALTNSKSIKKRYTCYQLAVILLLAEVAILVAAVLSS